MALSPQGKIEEQVRRVATVSAAVPITAQPANVVQTLSDGGGGDGKGSGHIEQVPNLQVHGSGLAPELETTQDRNQPFVPLVVFSPRSSQDSSVIPQGYGQVCVDKPLVYDAGSDDMDAIRLGAGKFWQSSSVGLVYGGRREDAISLVNVLPALGYSKTSTWPVEVVPCVLGFNVLSRFLGMVNESVWEAYISTFANQAANHGSYQDFSFSMQLPMTKEAALTLNTINPVYVDLQGEYGFYVEKYENVLDKADEKLLPNLYAFLSEILGEYLDSDHTDYDKLITMDGRIPDAMKDVLRNGKVVQETRGEYYDQWADVIKNTSPEELAQLAQMAQKVWMTTVPASKIATLNQYASRSESFPAHVSLELTMDNVSPICAAMREARIEDDMVDWISMGSATSWDCKVGEVREAAAPPRSMTVSSYDFEEWLSWLNSNTDARMLQWLVDKPSKSLRTNQLYKEIFRLVLVGKMRKLLYTKSRSFAEIIGGQLAAHETVAYRVDKIDSNRNLVQRFMIPNSDLDSVCKWVDTQVKYGKEYRYDVYAYQMVIGSEYSYRPDYSWETETGFKELRVIVENKPVIKIFEMPFFSGAVTIRDYPPIFPDVLIKTYAGVNNEVLFLLNQNTGVVEDYPISLDGIRMANFKTKFVSDDVIREFLIYRTDKRPDSYYSFADVEPISILTDISSVTDLKATSAAYRDTIRPNRPYYYIFRAVDVHGHVSNPTEIYEVELRDFKDTVIPSIKMYPVTTEIEQTGSPTKSFRRYLYIRPAMAQSVLNKTKTQVSKFDSATNISNPILGIKDESIYGKRWKIRLTSKETGKAVDFFVTFEVKPYIPASTLFNQPVTPDKRTG